MIVDSPARLVTIPPRTRLSTKDSLSSGEHISYFATFKEGQLDGGEA